MATSLWLVAGKPSFGAQPLPRFPRGGGFPFPFYNTSIYRPTGCCSKAFSRGAAPPVLSARRLPFPVLQLLILEAYWLVLESLLSGRSPSRAFRAAASLSRFTTPQFTGLLVAARKPSFGAQPLRYCLMAQKP